MLCHSFVAGQQQCRPLQKLRFGQPATSLIYRLLLNVKPEDMTVSANQACQQQGVMPVAAGRINRCLTFTHKGLQKQVRKRHRTAQNRYGYGSWHGGRG
jgi:hypothetical protein